jgi:nitroimidazol reductase NimA-like FMN-containing flavoprotein (pyridoxamine 5'-phosphate oxidase superfamily)
MIVHHLTPQECASILERATLGRLACVRDAEPYIVPIHVAFDGYHLYGLSIVGRKIEWMRANPRVCVEVDEIAAPGAWSTVLVYGAYEELTRDEDASARRWAEQLLVPRARYWMPALAKTPTTEHVSPVVYRIRIGHMTGRAMRQEP